MNPPSLRLEHLPAMRVAAARAVGQAPEAHAWSRLQAWAAPRGLLCALDQHPVFGFSLPGPAPEQPIHAYEFWIRVDASTPPDGDIEVKDVPGGLYATATCRRFRDPAGSVATVWRTLWEQVQCGPYRWRLDHDLQRPRDPLAAAADQVVDLYLPVELRPCVSLLTCGPIET